MISRTLKVMEQHRRDAPLLQNQHLELLQKLSVTDKTYRNCSFAGHIKPRTLKVMEQHRRDELALQSQHLEEEERKVQQALRETLADNF